MYLLIIHCRPRLVALRHTSHTCHGPPCRVISIPCASFAGPQWGYGRGGNRITGDHGRILPPVFPLGEAGTTPAKSIRRQQFIVRSPIRTGAIQLPTKENHKNDADNKSHRENGSKVGVCGTCTRLPHQTHVRQYRFRHEAPGDRDADGAGRVHDRIIQTDTTTDPVGSESGATAHDDSSHRAPDNQ